MNILFLSLASVKTIYTPGIYSDLLREFDKKGNKIYVISPVEKREEQDMSIVVENNTTIIPVKIGNIQKTSTIEKGINTLKIENQILDAIKKHLSDVKFDLVLYPTPPITLVKPVEYIKKRDGARSYLMLKDIFPQNAVDIGMMGTSGVGGMLYRYFRKKEKKLYKISDRIGCMSQANVEYLLEHNPEINPDKVEVCPNSIEVMDMTLTDEEKAEIRNKYGIPLDRKVFVYGGNLGKPQGIPFIIECLKAEADNKNVFFLIVGDGTEYSVLENFVNEDKPENVKLMRSIPRTDYDRMIAACDVGMIFLDHRFTIPNFPSRLLSYMQAKLPVLACTDPNSDIGKVIVEGGFGWWCESDDADSFRQTVNSALKTDMKQLGENGYNYLNNNYCVERAYEIIEEVNKIG